jgi:UDP-N-acetylglucosamine 2-epimerase (non-hydrolysing)
MLDPVLETFGIVPDDDLDLMRPDQTLAEFTARAIQALDGFMRQQSLGLVLVQGDTTTVFCAALAAFYHHVPVGHVEAGLRTGNLWAPWPEEANRVLVSRLVAHHFAPTELARRNLLAEGVKPETIHVTGNTVIDALLLARAQVLREPPRIPGLPELLQPRGQAYGDGSRMVLVTGHRRENFGQGFENICQALAELADRFPEVHFVYPVHLNPNVRGPVQRLLNERRPRWSNVHLIEPLHYLPFVALMDRCYLILTDSGGIQEEAPSLAKPVLVMREATERPEALEVGGVRLVGTGRERIVKEVTHLLTDDVAYQAMCCTHNPFGDGQAARRIANVILAQGQQAADEAI